MMDWIYICAVAFLTGITASMGLGGGFVLVLYLTLFAGVPQLEAQGTNLIFFLPIAVVSLIIHIKNKMVETSVLLPSTVSAALGVFIGVYAATLLGSEWLTKLFAVFVLAIGVRELVNAFRKPPNPTEKKPNDQKDELELHTIH